MSCLRCAALTVFALSSLTADAADWARFRGPDGSGVASDSESLPAMWSPSSNLAWNGMDRNKDGKVTMDELEGNRMADRLKTLDKDGDKAISKTEFTSGISTLFSRSGGGGGYNRKDTRPDRPQRPESVGK